MKNSYAYLVFLLAVLFPLPSTANEELVDCQESVNRAWELVAESLDEVPATAYGLRGVGFTASEVQPYLASLDLRIGEIEELLADCDFQSLRAALSHHRLLKSFLQRDWQGALMEANWLIEVMPASSAHIFDVIATKGACEVLLGDIPPQDLSVSLEALLVESLNGWGAFGNLGSVRYYSTEVQSSGILLSMLSEVPDPATRLEMLIAATNDLTAFLTNDAILQRRLSGDVAPALRSRFDYDAIDLAFDIYEELHCGETLAELDHGDIEALRRTNAAVSRAFIRSPEAPRFLLVRTLHRTILSTPCLSSLANATTSKDFLEEVLIGIASDSFFFPEAERFVGIALQEHGADPLLLNDLFYPVVRNVSTRLDYQTLMSREDYQSFVLLLADLAIKGGESELAQEYLESVEAHLSDENLIRRSSMLRAELGAN